MDQITSEQLMMMLAGTFALLNFGGWGYYVASLKHRAWQEGVAAGVLLGPLGPILIACLPTLEPKPELVGPAAKIAGGPRDPLTELLKPRETSDEQAKRLAGALAAVEARRQAEGKRYTDAEWAKRTPKDGAKP